MAADNALQLAVQVDADKANASVKSVNTSLSSIETATVSAVTLPLILRTAMKRKTKMR